MSATDSEQTFESPAVTAAAAAVTDYETCEQCASPMDSNQRYCVVCGTRRRHVYDPAARFLADATSRSRSASRTTRGPGAGSPKRRSPGLGLALALALIPLAVAAGALIAGNGNESNGKLLAALRAEKPMVVNVGGASTASGATTAAGTSGTGAAATPAARVTSSFAIQQGYAVELETLPGAVATEASVAAAESHARARGATAVGLLSQADFKITPAPPAGDYVIYSGQYHTSAQATSALAKLKRAFAAAKVIAVRPVGNSGPTQVLSTTSYGSAHQVSGFKPNAAQLATGGQVANQESKETNGSYVKSQQGLPDAISVP
ncbi:MAG: hypothetical protein ACLQA5_11500 [Solirubrobacteraceae bacterium]